MRTFSVRVYGGKLVILIVWESDPELRILVRSHKQISFVQIETGFLYGIGFGDGARVICLFAAVIQQLGFCTQKIQANVDYLYILLCLSPRRVHFARPWTQASKPALTDSTSSLAAKRRAETLHVYLFHPTIRAQHDDQLLLLLLCTLV